MFMRFLIFVCLFTMAGGAQALDGLAIMQKQDEVGRGYQSEKTLGTMTLINAKGDTTVREFFFNVLESPTVGDKTLIKFSAPADIQGTGLLSHENQGRDDDQWLYLPALGKTKRIASQSRGGSFAGSEFSYEDLRPFKIADHTYHLLGEEPCDETTCYKIAGTPTYQDSAYSKNIIWVRADNWQTIRTDFFDKKGNLHKQLHLKSWQLMQEKWWRAARYEMSNLQNKKSTTLDIRERKLNAGLSEADFSTNTLAR